MFFTAEKLEKQLAELRTAVYREVQEIPCFKFREGDGIDASDPAFDDRDWSHFQIGERWGGYDIVAWFRARVPIPADWGRKKLALRFLVGPRDGGNSTAEALLYVNGRPLQGIDVWHTTAWLPPEMTAAGEISIAIKAWSGVLGVPERRHFKLAQLVWIDDGAEMLADLTEALLGAVRVLEANDLRRVRLLQVVNEAFLQIDFGRPGSDRFYDSVGCAAQFLCEQVARMRVLEEVKPTITGIGHAHIDMAWLWRLKHTREKASRTFATVLHLMRQYPDYHFLHSSPQLYKYLKEDYPELYAAVRERIAEGRWEVTGATWIEPDVNLPSGESLVRQFLLGRRFVRQEFGVEMNVLWLPDVFGYSWSLPQIMKKSGVDYFMTTKLSWSQFNRFPYDTFYWRGIDGTEVLTQFTTTPGDGDNPWYYTYNGELRPEEVKGTWDSYQQKELNDELLLAFGMGDGGGGPTREMLATAEALQNLPGLPRVKLGKVEPYFDRLAQRLEGVNVPRWDGELYLEYHRGTYTSQAFIKRANRKAEQLYHNAEWLSAVADLVTGESCYPAEALREGWELILLNQFHDILPGSSIRAVYEDAHNDYAKIEQIGQGAVAAAQRTVLDGLALPTDSVVVFNPLPWPRHSLVALPWSPSLERRTLPGKDGQPLPSQVVDEAGEKRLLLVAEEVPSLGYEAYPLVEPGPDAANALIVTPERLENHYYRIELNRFGQIRSLYDKRHDREVLAPTGAGNVFQVFEDKPMKFDAWDIDIYYQEKVSQISELVEATVEESGPLRGVLRLRWRYHNSTITQRLTLYHHSPRIDFRTEIDWWEQQQLLKVAFPVDVRSTRATYDIQFGNIERPTHWNTSWDYARFESVGHKWVDLSEGNYGVALLNDCKYGHDIKDNVIRLTLIKSSIEPDPTADQGHHTFTYSLLPHAGDWRAGGVVDEAYQLNSPALPGLAPAQPDGRLPARYQFARVDTDHVIIETVKKAEDDEAWIIRLYEYQQARARNVHLTFANRVCRAVECNLVEEAEQPATYDGNQITFSIAPYEIKTFKVWLETPPTGTS